MPDQDLAQNSSKKHLQGLSTPTPGPTPHQNSQICHILHQNSVMTKMRVPRVTRSEFCDAGQVAKVLSSISLGLSVSCVQKTLPQGRPICLTNVRTAAIAPDSRPSCYGLLMGHPPTFVEGALSSHSELWLAHPECHTIVVYFGALLGSAYVSQLESTRQKIFKWGHMRLPWRIAIAQCPLLSLAEII